MTKKVVVGSLSLIILLVALFFSLGLVKKVQQLLIEASGEPADIKIDAAVELGPVNPLWQALAQGGEERFSLNLIQDDTAKLKPSYIRIDHIYDMYDVVKKNGNEITFDWSQLDAAVNEIIKAEARPFLSLSYMPPAISSGNITDPPQNWTDWQLVVQRTVEHFSGRSQRNLKNVIYEVWNEPDLFGGWRVGGAKDYRVLYFYSSKAAQQAKDVNPFSIGGPATTSPYENWVGRFLEYVVKNRLRFDFYSWHRYSAAPTEFIKDLDKVDTWLFQNAGYSLPKYLTEWGSDSENSLWHDGKFDAAHLVASVRQMIQRIDMAFTFEIKDGPSPENKKFWGRWGLFTHEKTGPIEKKPKYYAFLLLNKMEGNLLRLHGEGTWVTGFATKNETGIKIILANLDRQGRHYETPPITINNVENGEYLVKTTSTDTPIRSNKFTAIDGQLKIDMPLSPNEVGLVELSKR